MKTMSRRDIDRLMRYLIDFAYADVPGNQKFLFTDSSELNRALETLGLSDRKDQALHVLAGYGLIEFQNPPEKPRTSIILTNKGKAYFEMRRDARIALLCKSILIPVLVSLITTMIAVYLMPAVGRQVEQWMQGTRQESSQSQTTPAPPDDPTGNSATLQGSNTAANP